MLYIFPVYPVCDLVLFQKWIHQYRHFPHQHFKVKRFILFLDLIGFQFVHIQYIVDKRQQMIGRYLYLIHTFFHLLRVVCIFPKDLQHPHDAVDRCTDIMAYAVHEVCLGFAFCVGLLHRFLQPFFFLFFLFMEFRSVLKQDNSMYSTAFFSGLPVIQQFPGHQDRLLKPDHPAILFFFPVLYGDLFIAFPEAFQQFFRGIHDPVAFQRIVCHLPAPFSAVGIVRAWHLPVDHYTFTFHMVECIFQAVIGQIYGIYRFRSFH